MSDGKPNRPMARGLSALMADVGVDAEGARSRPPRPDSSVPIETVRPNPNQPRRDFDEDELSDLAASIRQRGVIQPIIVRTARGGGDARYEIVAGERRWRAAQRAGLHEVPVVIREMDDTELLEVAIIENIQRADLNAIEEAEGFRQLMDKFGHTQEKLSEVLGKSRSHVANLMRLLKLPASVQAHVREGVLSAGHARALINAPDPAGLAGTVIAKGLSVRETERLAKRAMEGDAPATAPKRSDKDADTRALEGDLTAALGLSVKIDHKAANESGRVTLSYSSLDELDRICAVLSGSDRR
ncbi:ParB/RepB/Spo0J family partition protein [Jannaschia ovalis]|uniref:ParB/RepB/Spo0J family partition protein n=1 Tax=Jannaschia ovalis TaxID=3038773 RepID=A0ABY8LI09_9RHOB|nr:ParB/RepB/Spo0J family partition protein [Jannaschia sp. GRR-S6-38]WGH80297.1 ParB/RepB/Spo0J family partition protein [Jannaschia sp. GRR-S6-38]